MRTTSQGHTVQQHTGSKGHARLLTNPSRSTPLASCATGSQGRRQCHRTAQAADVHQRQCRERAAKTTACIALTASQQHLSHKRVAPWLQLTVSRHGRVRGCGYSGGKATSHAGDWPCRVARLGRQEQKTRGDCFLLSEFKASLCSA